jgi:hypothetical protein
MVERPRGAQTVAPVVLVTVVLGLVVGGIAGDLFVTAQLTANPELITDSAVGFVASVTSDAMFGKLLGLDVVRASPIC